MAILIDKDPLTGVEQLLDDNEHEKRGISIHYQQDVEPVLDYCKMLRNDGLTDYGIKNDLWHYAHITAVAILKLKYEDGVDIFNRNHYPRLFQLLNTKYKYLKTTEKQHTVKH